MSGNSLVLGLEFDMQGSVDVREFHTEKHRVVRIMALSRLALADIC
jgi:hypothetical protein